MSPSCLPRVVLLALSLTVLGTGCKRGVEIVPDHAHVPYGEGENQWLNLYLAR